ncbi:glycosyltransferase family 2 protein [Bosea thiooxidans]
MTSVSRGGWPAPEELAAIPKGHPESLLELAKRYLAEGRPLASFLCADRLCRGTASLEATPLLLRGAALARLGHGQAARADLDLAARVNPEGPLVSLALLKDAHAARRIEGARRALSGEHHEARLLAQAALFSEGWSAIAEPMIVGDDLVVKLLWRERPPSLSASDGTKAWPLLCTELPDGTLQPDDTTSDFRHAGEARLSWPNGVAALRIDAPAGVFISSPIVRRARPAGRYEPSLTVAASGSASRLMIIVPVYDDAEATLACFEALEAARPQTLPHRIIVIDDDAPAPALRRLLEGVEARGWMLLRNPVNLGFAASVNRALALRHADEDALLLNADAFLPPGAIARLAAAASEGGVGTVTPLSNNGEDTSMPQRFRENPLPPLEQRLRIDALAAAANAGHRIDLPNGIGFCLYIAAAALNAVGPLSTAFGRGYYEDVEFCLRAAAKGFRNVCAADVYVGHAGSRSFRGDKRALVRRNLARLQGAFPEHAAQADHFRKTAPLRPAVARLEDAELSSRDVLDVLLLPGDCPDDLAEMVARALPQSDGLLLVRHDAAQGVVDLRGAAGTMPQNLDMRADDWFRQRDRAVQEGRIGHVAAIAPSRCDAGDVAALRAAARSWRVFEGDARDVEALRRAVPAHPSPRLAPGGGLAMAAIAHEPKVMDLARGVARNLAGERNVALLGRWRDDDRAMAEGLWVTGAMDWEEVGPWMERSGLSSLVLLDRAYATMLPLVTEWAASGVRIACFDGSAASPAWHAIDPALTDEAAASRIAAWALQG